MRLRSRFAHGRHAGVALAGALLLAGCQTETIALSPPMHARVVDGVTKVPLDHVQVTLVSRDTPVTITSYSDPAGFVVLPPLTGPDDTILRRITDTPRFAVRAIFQRPGYKTYTIDSLNGYGFFKGNEDVHLYPSG